MYLHTKKIAYCIIDNTNTYESDWIKSLMKNQADYTVTNVTAKNYDLFSSTSEDRVLVKVANLNYDYAVVFSTGTEFINGEQFFNAIKDLVSDDVFLIGHILDRGDAYYELHHQCYVVNLKIYSELGHPQIGEQVFGCKHTQSKPIRSPDNIHDSYTPTWVSNGWSTSDYNHKMHGWNILSIAFANNKNVLVFSEEIRSHKKHFYPENPKEFIKHISWAYKRQNYCQLEFIHTESTDSDVPELSNIEQLFVPASGVAWMEMISNTKPVKVIMYDYNQKALDYWKERVPAKENLTYKFIKIDLLHDDINIEDFLDTTIENTFINLTNIFAYEGTALFVSLDYRKHKEQLLIDSISELIPTAKIYCSRKSDLGITPDLTWHTYD